jgi:hypothetical protein
MRSVRNRGARPSRPRPALVRKRRSHLIGDVGEDAAVLAEAIEARTAGPRRAA